MSNLSNINFLDEWYPELGEEWSVHNIFYKDNQIYKVQGLYSDAKSIDIMIEKNSLEYIVNNESLSIDYCDTKNNVTYLVREMVNDFGEQQKTIMTVYYRNPIQMARRICEIKGWKFNTICRDHLFGNCNRSRCKYEHKSLD